MAGRRYSAGRIFLDVIPSFKGVIRETGKEVDKLRRQVADDNEKAAEQDEKGQARVRKRERVKGEREAGDAAKAEHDKAWRDMTIAEKREWGHRERLRREALARSVRDQKEAMVKADAMLAKFNAERYAAEEKARRTHEKRMAKIAQDRAVKQGQDMWKAVQDEQKAREKAAAELERAHIQAIGENLRRERRAAAERLKIQQRELREKQRELRRYAKAQGGRFGQDMREAISHALKDLGPDIKIDADTSEVDKKVQAVRDSLMSLQSKRIGIDISGRAARRELEAIENQVRRLDRRGIDIDVRTNAKGVTSILREQIDVMKAAGRGATDLGNRHKRAGSDSRDAANAFRIFSWRILLIALAIPAVVPLIAALAGAIGSLIPVALGAAAGLGVLIAGFTGIAPAVQALGDVQNDAAKDALAHGKTMRNASRAIRDAQQGLDRAHQDAARAAEDSARRVADARENVSEASRRGAEQVESALKRQQRAERDLRDAQQDSLRAQQDLTQARKDAHEQLRDMALRQAGGALAERQARLDLARAKAAYLSIKGSGAHTRDEKEQALLDFEGAELSLQNTILDNQRLAEERAHADRVGIEGSDGVVRAKERLIDATQRERDAEGEVADAATDVAEARADAAKMVADAQRDLSDALRDQRHQQEDSARAIRDANERLADSQAAYNEALQQTGEIGSASMRKLNEAMEALGPEGRAFALFLHGLREPLAQLRRDIQAGLLPGVQEFMEDMIRVYGPAFSTWATGMGVLLGDIFRQTSEVFQNPLMRAFFDSMERYAGVFTQQVSTIVLNLLQVVAGLSTAFAPFGVAFGDALVRITAGWAEWAGNLANSEGFYRFMDYVQRIGPVVTDFFVALGSALITIGVGLAPYGEMLINWATAFFSWIAEADPKVVGAIAAALIGVVVAIQLAAGAMTLLSGASMFFSRNAAGGFASPLALIVLGVVAVIGVVAILRANFEGFRDVTDQVALKLKELGIWLWENREIVLKVVTVIAGLWLAWRSVSAIIPVVMNGMRLLGIASLASVGWIAVIVIGIAALVAGFIHLWRTNDEFRNKVLAVWDHIKGYFAATVAWFSRDAMPMLAGAWSALAAGFQWVWDNILRPVWDKLVEVGIWGARMFVDYVGPTIGYAFQILWGIIQLIALWIMRAIGRVVDVLQDESSTIRIVLDWVGRWFSMLWTDAVEPALRGIGAIIEWVWKHMIRPAFENMAEGVDVMVKAFESGESMIASIWAGIVNGIADPMNRAIELVNKYFVKPLNGLLEDIGLDWKIPDIPDIPKSYYAHRERGATSRGSSGGGRTGVGRAATGTAAVAGVLPGYSPGVDNIRFTSPVGDLLLSGGEPIMRPEFGRVMGKRWIDQANAAAINGGTKGVERFILGAHASGTSGVDFSKLPRIPRTDIIIPKPKSIGARLWEGFTTAADVIRNPVSGMKKAVQGLLSFLPGGTFVFDYLKGALTKIGGLMGQKVKDMFAASAAAPGGNQAVNYGGPYGWNPNVSGMTWPSSWAMIKAVAPEAHMTSSYREGAVTANGIRSLHSLGRAVDFISPNMAETFMKIRNLRKWSQLFYSPMGNLQIGYRTPEIHRDHFSHIHAGFAKGTSGFDVGDFLGLSAGGRGGNLDLYDTGGILAHGDLGLNLSGKPEAVLTNEEWKTLERAAQSLRGGDGGGNTYEATVFAETDADPHEIAREMTFAMRALERRPPRHGGR